MAVSQREVYLLPFPPNIETGIEDHPFIVLSVEEANQVEDSFIGVMITSSTHKDDMSFQLSDNMFEKPLFKEGCHARMHLITLQVDAEINGKRINKMKEEYFKQLMRSIGEATFNYKFTPL